MKYKILVVVLLSLTNNLAYTQTNTLLSNSNGTVTDVATGLIWQQQSNNTARNHVSAIDFCQNLVLASQSDWRLPNVKELASIVDYYTGSPSIDEMAFPNIDGMQFWSESNVINEPSLAWGVSFEYGEISSLDKSNFNEIRCVR